MIVFLPVLTPKPLFAKQRREKEGGEFGHHLEIYILQ